MTERARLTATLAIRSRTLREGLRATVISDRQSKLNVPHYWAEFVHDGRGPVSPRFKSFLVYYVDPRDDPRLRGGYPVNPSDARAKRLTEAQFKAGMRQNYLRYRRNPAGGRMQFMVVTQRSGPSDPRKRNPFFTQGMRRFLGQADSIVRRTVDEEIPVKARRFRRFRASVRI